MRTRTIGTCTIPIPTLVRCKEQPLRLRRPRWGRCGEVTAFMFSFPIPPSLVLGLPSSFFPIINSHILPSGVSPSITRGSGHRSHTTERSRSYSARLCSVWSYCVEICSPWGRVAQFTLLNAHLIVSYCGPVQSRERSSSWSHTNFHTNTQKYNCRPFILCHAPHEVRKENTLGGVDIPNITAFSQFRCHGQI